LGLIGTPPANADEPNHRTIVITYGRAELVDILAEARTTDPMPFEMNGLIWEIGRNLESGMLAPVAAEEYLAELMRCHKAGKRWPVFVTASAFAPRPYAFLAHCLVMEAIARAQGESLAMQAILGS